MNQATGHLTDSEIEAYVGQDSTKNPGPQGLRLEAHLTDCESCLGRVLHAERNRLGLLEGDRMKEIPYSGCPPEETLQELAAGIAPPETAEATTEHAAHCDFCGPRLGRYLREFSEPLEAEDEALVKQLETSKPNWQKKFVRKHIADAEPRPKWSLFGGLWPKMAIAGAGVAIAAVLFIYLRPDDLREAQKLVASAYSERRTTEMRFPSAPFANFSPVPVVKGPADGGDWKSAPAPLVEAEAIVTKRGNSGELSPQWLQVEGRIDLLQGNAKGIDLAIDAFEKALAKDPHNLGLKVDLASAYFEKEMLADHERPILIKTIDLLNDVLKNAKQDDTQLRAAALFDLAIAYEKSEMLDLAANTWTQYLALDNTSGWAKEAQKHLDALKKQMASPKQQGYRQPSYFVQHALEPQIQQDLEEYQQIALEEWIRSDVRIHGSESFVAARQMALFFQQQHADKWWTDFLNAIESKDAPEIEVLNAAVLANDNDLHYEAIQQARKAAMISARSHNLPGELLAQFEEVYSLQRLLLPDACLAKADQLSRRLLWPELPLA